MAPSTHPIPASEAAPSASVLRRMASHFKYVCALNLICALIITFVGNAGAFFWQNLLASFCIGTLAYLMIDGVRLMLWGESDKPGWPGLLLLIAIAAPAAQVGGTLLFDWLMGNRTVSLRELASPKRLSLLLFTLMAAGAIVLFYAAREKIARQVASLQTAAAVERARAERVERQALQAQLQLLQAQIEPHMLFNTLANLQGLIAIDPARAQQLLDHLIAYLRATLSSSRAEHTTLGQECALMEAYLGLMAIRMGQRLSYSIDLPATLRSVTLPPMLLQPLVENAIQHGLEPKIDGGHIAVSAARDGNTLVLTVRDTGLGLSHPQSGRAGTHVGLANIRERLHALYGARAWFSLTEGAGTGAGAASGAIAQLTLPTSP